MAGLTSLPKGAEPAAALEVLSRDGVVVLERLIAASSDQIERMDTLLDEMERSREEEATRS